MSAMIRRLRALAPGREQLEANPWLRANVPIAAAGYLLISRAWIWYVAAKRRGVRS